jgi:hypothetical protein
MEPLFCRFGVIHGSLLPACLIGIRPPMSDIIIAAENLSGSRHRTGRIAR